jgi:uncharacterized membrane protein
MVERSEGMDEKDFREVCERLAKLEKAVGNGLREDIAEMKDALRRIQNTLEDLSLSLQATKTMQNIQWWFIGLIIVSFFISRFVK